MLLRHPADKRTLLWTLIFTPGVALLHYLRPEWAWQLFPFSMYFAVSCAVIAHNHMHCPVMKNKRANQLFSHWISIFYGYPVFAWTPTHNLNHHRYVNKHGDATITWRITKKHNVLVAASYFFVSSYYQGFWIKDFIQQAKKKSPALYRRILLQYVVTYSAHLALVGISVQLFGVADGLKIYALTFGIPAFFALWTVMLFNYIQHVHTDPWSKRNHSRNFTGKLLNILLFGNGYHTVHHDQANLHWADAAGVHQKIHHEIDSRLCHKSMWWFFFRQYALTPFVSKLGTVQVGRAPYDCPREQRVADRPETHDIGAVTAGGQI